MAERGGGDADVGGHGVGGAPEEQDCDEEVEEDRDGEDLLLGRARVAVDVGDVDFAWVEGGQEGVEAGRSGAERGGDGGGGDGFGG